MLDDFNHGICNEVAHRPWPMPDTPWIMTQTWHDLLFAHWRIDKALIASAVPRPLEVETFDGAAWIGVVPFHMTNVAPRGVPALPAVSAFIELNVRTYVRVDDKPGVYFFSLDASSRVAVRVARTMFHLPYYSASMSIRTVGDAVDYRSARTESGAPAAGLVASYRPSGPVFRAEPGSLEYFLTERYCLYTVDRGGYPCRLEIHHPPWRLQHADAHFEANTMTNGTGIELPPDVPLLHFAKRQDMVGWLTHRLRPERARQPRA
jgi:uncharacterized protein YqjF (DUF2071 family)